MAATRWMSLSRLGSCTCFQHAVSALGQALCPLMHELQHLVSAQQNAVTWHGHAPCNLVASQAPGQSPARPQPHYAAAAILITTDKLSLPTAGIGWTPNTMTGIVLRHCCPTAADPVTLRGWQWQMLLPADLAAGCPCHAMRPACPLLTTCSPAASLSGRPFSPLPSTSLLLQDPACRAEHHHDGSTVHRVWRQPVKHHQSILDLVRHAAVHVGLKVGMTSKSQTAGVQQSQPAPTRPLCLGVQHQ